ncbi:hypothetical protein BT67DRAFT_98532 [Trichocladium antarcticum]|uniref:Uncharacterized protein n=1 Tax=Trichocladium antarcticum TaxID=1450529 RepID=A0AAN6ZGZ8_9PEZI|nr:hypothetical protein BT67DRAFT_98532 [Trichocladium antarcticum]
MSDRNQPIRCVLFIASVSYSGFPWPPRSPPSSVPCSSHPSQSGSCLRPVPKTTIRRHRTLGKRSWRQSPDANSVLCQRLS